jgi:hypothetical protein
VILVLESSTPLFQVAQDAVIVWNSARCLGDIPLMMMDSPKPAITWEFSKLLGVEAAASLLLYILYRIGGWRDVWRFLAGSFFVSAGVLYYLAVMGVSVPILGTRYVETPEVSRMRAIAHSCFFLACLYFGFIRSPQHNENAS